MFVGQGCWRHQHASLQIRTNRFSDTWNDRRATQTLQSVAEEDEREKHSPPKLPGLRRGQVRSFTRKRWLWVKMKPLGTVVVFSPIGLLGTLLEVYQVSLASAKAAYSSPSRRCTLASGALVALGRSALTLHTLRRTGWTSSELKWKLTLNHFGSFWLQSLPPEGKRQGMALSPTWGFPIL